MFEYIEDSTTSNKDFPIIEMGNWHTTSRLNIDKPLNERIFGRFYLRADQKNRYYKRWTDTLLGYIGDLGGMKEFILGIGFLLCYPFMKH